METGKVNGDDKNIAQVNNRRENFMNQTCEADHFGGGRGDNFVINTCNDKNIDAVGSNHKNIYALNKKDNLQDVGINMQ